MPLHTILLGTFRHSFLYELEFDASTRRLSNRHTHDASGGHSWLHLSAGKDKLYTTVWGDRPQVAAYNVKHASESSDAGQALDIRLNNEVSVPYLSGYVTADDRAVYSASGPQGDVLPLRSDGGLQEAVQSVSFSEAKSEDAGGELAFGGLRNGGHSADLSPDGKRLYVADIGRNCVWVYHVAQDASKPGLSLASKYLSKRGNDGPRHAWPHPNGRIVYCVQEHSSYVDVLEHDGDELVWREGVNLLPEGMDANDFWADEVRLDASSSTLFGSTRGLEPSHKGYVCSWPLSADGRLAPPSGNRQSHRYQTPTSGGWANAIAACPTPGPAGETWLTLTDSEEGLLLILSWTEKKGFEEVARWQTPKGEAGEVIGASVAVWYS